MPDTYINQAAPDRGSVYDSTKLNPNVVYNVASGSEGLDSLVKNLDSFLNEAHKSLDKETVRKAQLAGSFAGLQSNYKPMEGDTLAAEAFNRAGTETFVNKKLSDVSTSIHKVSLDPELRNDPVKMEHRLQDMQAEFLKDVPLEAMPDFQVAYNDRMKRAIQGAQSNQMEMQLSANKAQFMETESALLAEITNAARSGDEDALNQARAEYFSSVDKQIGLTLMPAEAAEKKLTLQKQVRKDAMIGDFLRTPPEQRPVFVENFIKNNPLMDMMQAEEIDDLKREMIQAWNVDENLADAAEAETKKNQDAAVDEQYTNFILAPTSENYQKLVVMPGIKAERIASARQFYMSNHENPDPIKSEQIEDLIYSGNVDEARKQLNDPETAVLIGKGGMRNLWEKMQQVKDGGGFEKTEAWKEFTNRIREDYSDELGLGSVGKTIRQEVYDTLRTKYPKYLNGEIPYDDVDPIRLYKLKQANANTSQGGNGRTISVQTKNGPVVIPNKYVEDPAAYFTDIKIGIDDRLKDTKVKDYIIMLRINKEKEEKAKLEKKP